jgi:glycosyltransferase involved in cell wall biosynthesis
VVRPVTAAGPSRILYCDSNVDGTVGGSQYCLLYLTERLDRTRFEPVVVFYEEHALVPRFRAAGIDTRIIKPNVFRIPIRAGSVAALAPVRLALRLVQRAVNFTRSIRRVQRYRRLLKSERIEAVHLNNSIMRSHDWMIAARLTGIPCLTHERGYNPSYSRVTKAFGRRLAKIISVSQAVRDYMVQHGMSGERVTVMYDGLDVSQLRPERSPEEIRRVFQIEADQPVLGIVGNIRHWKGQEVVVRAMSLVRGRYPRAVCLLVGATAKADQWYEDRLRALVQQLGLERNVVFAGYQSNPCELLDVMDVCVHASIQPEPFGMVVLEAMARRKPLIGSRAGGVPEIVVEGVTGYTYPPGDWKELSARVIELLGDPARARDMGERGYQRVIADFQVDKYVRDIEALYGRVLSGANPASTAPVAIGQN